MPRKKRGISFHGTGLLIDELSPYLDGGFIRSFQPVCHSPEVEESEAKVPRVPSFGEMAAVMDRFS